MSHTLTRVGLLTMSVSILVGLVGLALWRYGLRRTERRGDKVRREAIAAIQRGENDAAVLHLVLGHRLPPIAAMRVFAEATGKPVEEAKAEVIGHLPRRHRRLIERPGPRVDELLAR
jgi:hypothetical protein